MSASDTLALLIPAYNATPWLERLLVSAKAQTQPFDEIWVYDDCSTDGTAELAERLGARVVRGEVNRGCSAGKNVLAARTSATWVHFHDADDELLPNFAALARRWMAAGSADVVLFPYEERDDLTGAHIAWRRFDPADVAADPRSYAIREQINPFCGLYRRAAFLAAGGHDEDPLVLYNEDVAVHVRLAFAGLAFAAERDVSIINHRRLDSMSAANALKCVQAQYNVMRKALDLPGAETYHPEIASRLWRSAGLLAAHLDWDSADRAAALAARLAPPTHADGSSLFRLLASFSPSAALRVRETLIRLVRPAARATYPQHRSAAGPRS